ncbi:MAG: hypothetical protein H6811_04935 [Phycisphaeraceae bacterium]|nr:hypothetical protein [Phycisphaeraceae bacterium]
MKAAYWSLAILAWPDGAVDASDFFYFLDLFAAGDLGADMDDDGDLDADDFFGYLDLFAQGC